MHRFVAALSNSGNLLRNYTQNIDGLEEIAGAHAVSSPLFAVKPYPFPVRLQSAASSYADILGAASPDAPAVVGEVPRPSSDEALFVSAGVKQLISCCGSVSSAVCLACREGVPVENALCSALPRCQSCSHELNLLKPSLQLFGDAASRSRRQATLTCTLHRPPTLPSVGLLRRHRPRWQAY